MVYNIIRINIQEIFNKLNKTKCSVDISNLDMPNESVDMLLTDEDGKTVATVEKDSEGKNIRITFL